ncbi:hypothetical protein G3554_11060 [Micromonospora sp. PPF5-17]|uniref:Uncharacterized protein n=2 Tax=Micromonosporaceae TaxID=28056 RepID=A0ABX9WGS6_9ACTN|nr:hypothetical protein [Micromonospora sp. PPF5-17B]NES36698.1 hypothetical protein [Micromonospora solifontis]NES55725.1 hypothetical protein [Micromonospora sp. PPF5-6]RNL99160.1 hypothetical protein EFE23_11100 [Micromonospora solifontis]
MSETGTAVPAPRAGGSMGGADPVETAWADYVAAARQLDGVRRAAATAATEQARSVAAAREELTVVREWLAPQQSRLRELGVPAISLVPTPPEVTESARSMAGGPAAVLAALRAARGWAESADDTLAARGLPRLARWPARPRNLLVYGPVALLVPLVQLLLFAVTGTGPVSIAALVVGLPMPAVAFMVGWLAVGRLFRPRPADRVDRTPRFGALVCLVPAVLATAGLVLAMFPG